MNPAPIVRRFRGLFWLIAVGATVETADAKTFADNLTSPIERPMAEALAEAIGRSLPITAASSGLVFRPDPDYPGALVADPSIVGQLFLERPDTIGKGKWNFALTYQRVKIDTFEGEDLGELSDRGTRILDDPAMPEGATFAVDRFGIDLETQELITSATYGLTKDLELNVAVPILYSEFGLDIVTDANEPVHVRSTKLGIGDTLVRGKYRLPASRWAKAAGLRAVEKMHAALGLVLRIPSGEEDNFQGTGAVELAPMVYASWEPWPAEGWLKFQPYLNAGVNFNAEDVDGSETRWGLGLDCGIAGKGTVAVAVVARNAFRRIAEAGTFDFARVSRSGRVFSAPLFGIRPERPDYYDFSVGGRVSVWKDTFILFANALVPLNDDGFRSTVIPLVGVEAAF